MAPKFVLLFVVPNCECKSSGFFYSEQILEQKSFLSVWFCCFFLNFATANRKVAQLVAHYVRDVGVGRSNRLFPTRSVAEASSAADFFCAGSDRKQKNVLYFSKTKAHNFSAMRIEFFCCAYTSFRLAGVATAFCMKFYV